jgi:hypothetical protein
VLEDVSAISAPEVLVALNCHAVVVLLNAGSVWGRSCFSGVPAAAEQCVHVACDLPLGSCSGAGMQHRAVQRMLVSVFCSGTWRLVFFVSISAGSASV